MEARIRASVQEALVALGAPDTSFAVEWPADLAHGDYATNAAMAAAKTLGRNPRELAIDLASFMRDSLGADITSVEAAGPGFVNITLSPDAIARTLTEALGKGDAWGQGGTRALERVIFEYSCPNPFKEMHIGHLMSTVIGEASARLVESQGARVIRDTYGGDVGPHVAKALWALKEKGEDEPVSSRDLGKAYEHGSRAYEESADAKAAIDALNTALYAALAKEDAELSEEERVLLATWRHGRDVSYAAHGAVWQALGTKFDYIFHESETAPIGMRIVADNVANGVFTESEGAVIYDGEKRGLHTLVFITSRGTPTYETKDVGLAFLKEERIESDRSYIVTAAEQQGHFRVFLAALKEIAPALALKTAHVPHGFLRLTTGKMSSREGNVITAAGLLEEVMARARERNEDPLVAEQVAVGAVKYMVLRSAPGSDIIFDPEKSLSLDGDSGPYLQYALVRAKSILAQATKDVGEPTEANTLARRIARFPEVVARAERLGAPHALTTYLTELASEWNSYYAGERILGSDAEAERLALVRAFAMTLENGLRILGIPAPEKL